MMENIVVPVSSKAKAKKTAKKTISIVYIALIIVLLYLPVMFIILESFNSSIIGYEFGGFTTKWYEAMFTQKGFKDAVTVTFTITLLSTTISTIFGTFFAIGINSLSNKRRQSIIMLNNIPVLNSDIVSAIFLFIIFQTVGAIFGREHPLGYTTLLLSHIFFSLPYVVLSVLPKLREIDENLFDAAQDLGCTPFKALIKVIIPAIAGGIFSGAVLAFTMSIDDFTISYFVSGADIENLSIWINNIRTVRFGKLQIASSFYTIFTILMFVILIVYNVLNSKRLAKKKVK